MRLVRLVLFTLGALGCAACGGDEEQNNNPQGNACLCYVYAGSVYDTCVENPSYGCDCASGGQTTLEPPCN